MSYDASSLATHLDRGPFAPDLQRIEGGDGPLSGERLRVAPLVSRVVARRKRGLVFLAVEDVWAFEADARLAYVHARAGRFDVDVSLAEIESCPFGSSFARVHRRWLVNLAHVRELRIELGMADLLVGGPTGDESTGIHVPVARDLVRAVRERLLATTIGLRRREHGAR